MREGEREKLKDRTWGRDYFVSRSDMIHSGDSETSCDVCTFVFKHSTLKRYTCIDLLRKDSSSAL